MAASGNLSDVLSQLPNPFTPMAFLPPELAYQVTVAMYVLVGSLAVLIWDILSNLCDDFRMLTQYRIKVSVVVYFISRTSCLAYLAALVVLETAPVGHCENIKKIQALYPIAIPSTSLLFFFRVCALYNNKKHIVILFSLSWLAVLAGSITTTQGIAGAPIGNTKYCINSRLESYVSLACILSLVNDTMVFCATTWALMQNSYAEWNVRNGVRVAVLGRYLPAFSRAVLQDGQIYYATTVSLNLVVAIMFFNTAVPIVYRSFFGVPNIVLMNIMSCYVYRKVRFGVFRELTMASLGSTTLSVRNTARTPSGQQQQAVSGLVFDTSAVNNRSVQLTERSLRVGDERVESIRMDVVQLKTSDDGNSIVLRGPSKEAPVHDSVV